MILMKLIQNNKINEAISMFIIITIAMLSLDYFNQGVINNIRLPIILLLEIIILIKYLLVDKNRINLTQIILINMWIVFFCIAIFSNLVDKYMNVDTIQTTMVVFISTITFIIIISLNKNKILTFNNITKLLMWYGFFISILGILIKIFGGTPILIYRDSTSVEYRQILNIGFIELSQIIMGSIEKPAISLMTSNPNIAGILVGISMICTIYNIKLLNYKKYKIMWLIQCLGVIFTFSKGSIVSTLIMHMIIMMDIRKYNLSTKNIKIIVNTMMLFTLIFILIFIKFVNESQIYDSRIGAWKVILKSVQDNIFFGIGFGSCGKILLASQGFKIAAHNSYLTILAEMGIIGIIAICIIYIFCISKSLNRKYTNINDKRRAITSIVIIIGISLNAIVESTIMNFSALHFLWVYFLTFCTINLREGSNE